MTVIIRHMISVIRALEGGDRPSCSVIIWNAKIGKAHDILTGAQRRDCYWTCSTWYISPEICRASCQIRSTPLPYKRWSKCSICDSVKGEPGGSHSTWNREPLSGPSANGLESSQSWGFSCKMWFMRRSSTETSQSIQYVIESSISLSSGVCIRCQIPQGPSCTMLKRNMSWGLLDLSPHIWRLCEFQLAAHSWVSVLIWWRKRWWSSQMWAGVWGSKPWCVSSLMKKFFHFCPKAWVTSYHKHSICVLWTLLIWDLAQRIWKWMLQKPQTVPRYMTHGQGPYAPASILPPRHSLFHNLHERNWAHHAFRPHPWIGLAQFAHSCCWQHEYQSQSMIFHQ